MRPVPQTIVRYARRVALCVAALAAASPAAAQIRIVVHPSSPVTGISMQDLARVFRGEYASFAGDVRTTLAEYAPARAAFYTATLRMSEDQVRRHWIRLVFAGNPVTPPRGFESADDLIRFVARSRGAIAFVDGPVPDSVKVLAVNGRLPGEPGYPLP